MRKAMLIVMMVGALGMMGCASQLTTAYDPPAEYPVENTMVYKANIDRTWNAAIKAISEKFFVLDNIEKDSRIITLSFSTDDPSQYLDCGVITHTLSGGMSGNGQYVFDGAEARTQFALPDGTPHPKFAERSTRIEGKINIVLMEEGKNTTRATVTVRYVMAVKIDGQRYVPIGFSGLMVPFSITGHVSLTTGQSGKIDNGGLTTCVTKYTLEKMILDSIQSKL